MSPVLWGALRSLRPVDPEQPHNQAEDDEELDDRHDEVDISPMANARLEDEKILRKEVVVSILTKFQKLMKIFAHRGFCDDNLIVWIHSQMGEEVTRSELLSFCRHILKPIASYIIDYCNCKSRTLHMSRKIEFVNEMDKFKKDADLMTWDLYSDLKTSLKLTPTQATLTLIPDIRLMHEPD